MGQYIIRDEFTLLDKVVVLEQKLDEIKVTNIDFDDKDYDFYGNKNLVDFEVYFQIDEEEINESYEEEIKSGKLDLNNLTKFEFSLEEMTLNDIRLFMSKLDEIENNNGLFRVKGTDLIYQIIY